MLRTTRDACTPDPSVLRSDYKDQIEDLATLQRDSRNARAFFARNHITAGMRLLFEQCLRRLAGKSEQAVFELAQAMGGGKTHSMVALGLAVRDDALRAEVVPDLNRSAPFTGGRVVAFSGRNYPDHFFWGEIAKQLGRAETFNKYWQQGPSAPDEAAWLGLLGDEPTLILLDELPPYFEYHVTKVVGAGNVAQVAQAAFANLLTAALKSPRTAIVVANLRGAYDTASRDLQRVLRDAGQELGRSAKSIMPVDLASDEIFEILRKRLFSALPGPEVVAAVGDSYAKAFAEAVKSQAIAKSSEQIASEIQGSYPFHPSIKDVIALFRENESFRQTRGLMRFVAQLVRSVWNRPANDVHLIGIQHIDLSDSDVRAEVTGIAESLANAIASDVSSSNGSAKAEVIDAQLGKDCAAEAARLLLAASLGKTVGGLRGMTRQRALECLVAPNTSVHEFAEAFDALTKEAWYLHRDGELHYFTAMENLTKRLSSELREAPQNKIEQEMRRRLEEVFKAKERKAYDKVHALPLLDEVNLRDGRVLLVLSPDTKDPPREALAYYQSIAEKNNVCILTGDGSDLSNLESKTRMLYAVVKLKRTLPETSPQQRELDEKLEQAEQDFNATLKASLDRLYYPTKQGLERAKFVLSFESNSFDGELQVERTLLATGVNKLVVDIESNFEALSQRAEDLLWGTGQRRTSLQDFRERSRSNPRWTWLPSGGLETLRKVAEQRGVWRNAGDGSLEKGPFPAEKSEVRIVEIDRDEATGEAVLQVSALNAGAHAQIYYSARPEVSEKSERMSDSKVVTRETRLWFRAIDPTGKSPTGDSYEWRNQLIITHQPRSVGGKRTVALSVQPAGALRYSLDGSNPAQGIAYDRPIDIGAGEVRLYCHADHEGVTARRDFVVPPAQEGGVAVPPDKPVTLRKRIDRNDTTSSYVLLARSAAAHAKLGGGVSVTVGSGASNATLRFGSDVNVDPVRLEAVITALREALGQSTAEVQLNTKVMRFEAGVDFTHLVTELDINVADQEIEL